MHRHCLVAYPGQEKSPEVSSYKLFSDLLKAHPEGLYRSAFFFETDKPEAAVEAAGKRTLAVSGPFTVSHCIRKAGDMILENCHYDGMEIHLEVDGKKLPELPTRTELEKLLKQEKTIISVDGKQFRPNTEVLGFQQVYDDSVKVIETLKSLGVTQEAMMIMATPEEISIEVHPGLFGLPEDAHLPDIYRALLFKVAGLKMGDKRPMKTTDRTILIQSTDFSHLVLLPGAIHPTLHRPRVCVGPSHFAYGPAAFSDYCGKKRSLDDSLKELRAWIKFIETPQAVLPKVKEALASLGKIEAAPPPLIHSSAAAGGQATRQEGGFQPLKREIQDSLGSLPQSIFPLSSGSAELNKSLGGGWAQKAVHVIAAGREEGKTAFLLSQAIQLAGKNGVLFVSREMKFNECVTRAASWVQRTPVFELAAKAGLTGPEGDAAREKYRATLKASCSSLPETLFFRGADSSLNCYNLDELIELLKMIPAGQGKILMVDGLLSEELEKYPGFFDGLRAKAISMGFTALIAVHTAPNNPIVKPHYIENPDLELLNRWQGQVDTIVSLNSERLNLKKFLMISQGKLDPAVAEKLEQKFYQTSGVQRLRHDTYTMIRVLHSRLGLRQAILNLFQREINRFWEGPALLLGRS